MIKYFYLIDRCELTGTITSCESGLGCKYCDVILAILSNINHLFAHNK